MNTKDDKGRTPLDGVNYTYRREIKALLRKHGGKTGEELKAEGSSEHAS